ncbi:hypothetical protein BKA62DRAFT_167365 [Auriculariales sp. MPI-PUGE-AT-0066]|nr:hypothetical protein BKA62DRAFT_167365 [Auriculariales sp. MPI-PUGE-AT-0066]
MLTREIVDFAESTLALLLRQSNRDAVPQYWLPTELWNAIWLHLTPDERLTVSHVSHDWRAIALACPNLWSAISFVSSAHSDECACNACLRADNLHLPCVDCGRPWLHGRGYEDIEQVSTYLERSGGQPLHMDLTVLTRAAARTREALAAALTAHLPRVTTLRVAADDADDMDLLLDLLSVLPAVTSLTLEMTGENSGRLLTKNLQMPSLQVLDIRGDLTPDRECKFHCPAVSTVKSMFLDAQNVLAILRGCPAVEVLELEVGSRPVETITDEICEDIHDRFASGQLKRLRISKAYVVDMAAIMQIFICPSTPPSFTLHSHRTEIIEIGNLTTFFSNMEDATSLECIKHGHLTDESDQWWSLALHSISNEEPRRREITITLGAVQHEAIVSFFRNVWGCLPARATQKITEIRADNVFWTSLFDRLEPSEEQAIPPPPAPIWTKAIVVFEDAAEITEWLELRRSRAEDRRRLQLSQLEHLYIRIDAKQPVQLGERTVRDVVAEFSPPAFLHSLRLEGATMAVADVEGLSDLAASVEMPTAVDLIPFS